MRRTPRSSAVAAIVVVLLIVQTGVALGQDFRITGDYSRSEQNNPAVAVGPGGKFAVIWADFSRGNGDVICQLFDSGAAPIGDNFPLNDDGSDAWQFDPDLAADWYGNYYAVWVDYRNSTYPFNPDIYFQRLDSVGFIGGNRNATQEQPDSSHQSPAVSAAGWTGTVVAWADLRFRNWDVFVQTVGPGGDLVGSNIKANDDVSGAPQHEPDVAVASDGGFVVTWYDGRNGNDDIYLQRYDSSGKAIGSNLKINDDPGTGRQKFPSVTVGGNDITIVVWTDWRNGQYPANSDVYLQRFDADFNRLGGNLRVNLDGTARSQRDAKAAADRMGNVCVVWSDSGTTNWDVRGQMFDVTGKRRGENFPVNLDTGGNQLLADVVLDGYFLYAVWADDRNGDYDIYGRILQYNIPSLVADPYRIEISRDRSDPPPNPLLVTLTNAGYGELDYQLSADQAWITLSKSSGRTPDTVIVTLITDTLGFGVHRGQIRLIDLLRHDSTAFVPILISVTGPRIDPRPDSLSFEALAEIGPPSPQIIVVNNSGSGWLAFTAETTAPWLSLDQASGQGGDTLSVGCNPTGLEVGHYTAYIVLSDPNALNNPESVTVYLEVQYSLPFLIAEPPELSLSILKGETATDSLQILNRGASVSNWRAACDSRWMTLIADAGQDDDYIIFRIETSGLETGIYDDSITVVDTQAFNNPLSIPVEVTVLSTDSIIIQPAQVRPDEKLQLPVFLHCHDSVHAGQLDFRYDTAMLTFDSLVKPLGGEVAGYITFQTDTIAGEFLLLLTCDPGGIVLPGVHFLGDLCATARASALGTTTIQSISPPERFYLEDTDGRKTAPVLVAGSIEISEPLTAYDDENGHPLRFRLEQNRPNPFNANTSVQFELPKAGSTRLTVYNILGQEVAALVTGFLPAGIHEAVWNGRDNTGREMAAGIYFYKLSVPDREAVRKMIYLK